MNEYIKILLEEDEEEYIEDDDFIDDDLPDEDPTLEDEEQFQDEEMPNEMIGKTIQFPIIIEGYNEEDEATSMQYEDEQDFASQYGDAVVENVNQNKKFISSALDVYDFEFFYDSFDRNNNVKFIVSISEDIENNTLMNVLKRYFNVEVENMVVDGSEFSLTPVLDSKFIKVMSR